MTAPTAIKKPLVFHPFLLGAWVVLSLYAHNIYEFPLMVLWRPLTCVLAGTAVLMPLCYWANKNWHKSGLIVSIFILFSFSFGHCRRLFNAINGMLGLFGLVVDTSFLLWFIFLAVTVFAISRTTRDLSYWTRALNITTAFLTAICLSYIAVHKLPSILLPNRYRQSMPQFSAAEHPTTSTPQYNIFYIIVDAYARSDILKRNFGRDNRKFIDHLASRGFYIAEKSRSNYMTTKISITSSLNFAYLNHLLAQTKSRVADRLLLIGDLVFKNRLFPILKRSGFTTAAAISSDVFWANLKDVDRPLITTDSYRNEFLQGIIDLTPVVFVADNIADLFVYQGSSQYLECRNQILSVFQRVPQAARSKGPLFVFAHINSPHTPFLFGSNGEELPPPHNLSSLMGNRFLQTFGFSKERFIREYGDQHHFISTKVARLVDDILSVSSLPPIIIVQSDHGATADADYRIVQNNDLMGMFGILNAYYFPDGDYSALYPEITPVNTFRVILNKFFGGHYPLLKDRCYFTSWDAPANYTDVTDETSSQPKKNGDRPPAQT